MSIVVKSEYSHKVTKIEASQGVSLVDDSIFDQTLSHFCEYSLFIRVLGFEYSYERILESIRILFVLRSNEPRIPKLRIRGHEYQQYRGRWRYLTALSFTSICLITSRVLQNDSKFWVIFAVTYMSWSGKTESSTNFVHDKLCPSQNWGFADTNINTIGTHNPQWCTVSRLWA